MMLDATGDDAQPRTEDRFFAWQASLFPTGRSGSEDLLDHLRVLDAGNDPYRAAAVPAPAEPAGPDEEAAIVAPSGKPTLPDYMDAFRKTCDSIPPTLAAKAILAAGRFAAHENAIWRQTKPIKRLPEHYRIRISLDYRMIVHWQPGKLLRILDVIPRF
jgi:hypothetical protein